MKRLFTVILLVNACYLRGQVVSIPDANFLSYLIERGIDTNTDGKIQITEAESFSGEIDVKSKKITDLKGIESFKNIIRLDCRTNSLKNLNVSSNLKLKDLLCGHNQLSSIDITKNIMLNYFYCEDNNISTLDVSKNTKLDYIFCGYNNLTTLDITHNVSLVRIDCEYNKLTELDLSKNINIMYRIEVQGNQLTSLDVSKNTKVKYLNCEENKLTSLDLTNNPDLLELTCYKNNLASLDIRNNTKITSFDAKSNPKLKMICVSSISEVEEFQYLKDDNVVWSEDCILPMAIGTGLEDYNFNAKKVISTYNLQGQSVSKDADGVVIFLFEDGTRQKIFNSK